MIVSAENNAGRPAARFVPARPRLKVAWLCGGYEPGADGVGDFVRRVSRALDDAGETESMVIALRDPEVAAPRETAGVLRLPAATELATTVPAAAASLEQFDPDVIAWNFVPQMFAPRGIIPEAVAETYALLRTGRRLVLFMHEWWCGTGREDTVRNFITGAVQRRTVLRWIGLHEPDLVLTSNPAYAAVARHHGIEAQVVPLCSNVARRGGVDRERWPGALAAQPFAHEPRAEYLLAGVFGAIHSVWQPEHALAELAAYAVGAGKKLAVVWLGRGSPASVENWKRVSRALAAQISFVRVGALEESSASELLECCDLGLPTIQSNLLGKSGTAAAFLEHGVPLLVAAEPWTPRFAGFVPAATSSSIAVWGGNAKPDWAQLLAARPEPGVPLDRCVAGWRLALTAAVPRVAAES